MEAQESTRSTTATDRESGPHSLTDPLQQDCQDTGAGPMLGLRAAGQGLVQEGTDWRWEGGFCDFWDKTKSDVTVTLTAYQKNGGRSRSLPEDSGKTY